MGFKRPRVQISPPRLNKEPGRPKQRLSGLLFAFWWVFLSCLRTHIVHQMHLKNYSAWSKRGQAWEGCHTTFEPVVEPVPDFKPVCPFRKVEEVFFDLITVIDRDFSEKRPEDFQLMLCKLHGRMKKDERIRQIAIRAESWISDLMVAAYPVAVSASDYHRRPCFSSIYRLFFTGSLCDTICNLTNDTVKSITCRQWISDALLIWD